MSDSDNLRSWYPWGRDFYLAAKSLVERVIRPNAPSLMQTMLFRKWSTAKVVDENRNSLGFSVVSHQYYWLEAQRIEDNKYMLVSRKVTCFQGESALRKTDSRVSTTAGRSVFSAAEAAGLIQQWEKDESLKANALIIRTPEWTPMHCSRWCVPPEGPPKGREPLPERPAGDNVVVVDFNQLAA